MIQSLEPNSSLSGVVDILWRGDRMFVKTDSRDFIRLYALLRILFVPILRQYHVRVGAEVSFAVHRIPYNLSTRCKKVVFVIYRTFCEGL